MTIVTESLVEDAALDRFRALGYHVRAGPDLGPAPGALRKSYAEVVIDSPLRGALTELNPDIPDDALRDAQRKLLRPAGATVEDRNRSFHRMLVDGVPIEYRDSAGVVRGAQVRVVDFEDPEANFWEVVNQFTVEENRHRRRPDIVVFVNGLPLAIIELKNPTDETASVRSAYNQLQTYQAELPTLFACNAVLVVSDGLEARIGTLTAGHEWFKPWRTIGGEELAPVFYTELQTMIQGVFEKSRFLALFRDFIVFEDDGGALAKKVAGYHQFHAVETAVAQTLRAAELGSEIHDDGRYESGRRPGGAAGDRRIGVVWHTQGSGKSLTMAFYAGRIVREARMGNPTIVVLTDRNDLDDQLFGTFARCSDLLRQPPAQATSRADLRAKLAVASGGVVFTTIQKFFPEDKGDRYPLLSDRRNIVVIADEAHRSQYDFIDGFARHMRDALPNASFIGFTGTPIELEDANTRAVFGDYISVYDIERAVEDRATVPIYFESRLAKLALDEAELPGIDPGFEEVTEGEESERKEKLKTKWAQLEAVVGAAPRLGLIARDVVSHFEKRVEALDGKAMIVCMSRRICIDLYRELTLLRPDWHGEEDGEGRIKVVMTGGASDPPGWQPHIRNKARRETLAKRFRDPADPLRMVVVRDMWLTGFDAPSLHAMYVEKPMRGHGLMQAVARVNRVLRDKPGGLIVDYLCRRLGRRRRRFRRGRPREARHVGPVGGVPGRSTGHEAAQPRGGAAAEAAQRGVGQAQAEERGAGQVLRRDARTDRSPLREPRGRGRAGHRGTDRARPRPARGERPRRGAGAQRRRAGFLRRAGDERQRRTGARRRDVARDRARVGRHRAQQRHDRLDPARERPRQLAPPGQARSAQARLPAGQAGEGDADRARTGGGAVGGVGGLTVTLGTLKGSGAPD